MIIHVVEEGETINSIAEQYGLSVNRLALENGISTSANLAIGETLVILRPEIVYTVRDGDTLSSIARSFNISIMELLRNNPYLSDRQYIYPGEDIVIKYENDKIEEISTNGYAYPFIDIDLLKKTLPFLTFLSIYSHYYTSEGGIISINDEELIRAARDYGVAPIMILTGFGDSLAEEIETIHDILSNPELQDTLISNLISVLDVKAYYGVNLTTPYISPEYRHLYVEFIRKFSTRLRAEGYSPFITLTRSTFELLTNVDYGDFQYEIIGQLVDYVIIITYEWGFSYGLPPTILSFEAINNIIEYGISLIPSDKMSLGYSTIGYVWRLPYIEGVSRGQSITFDSAIELARKFNAIIHYDEITKASYFQYFFNNEYIIRFRDARGINDLLALVSQYGIDGIVIWNIMYFFNQMWLVINSQYNIRKLIPMSLEQ